MSIRQTGIQGSAGLLRRIAGDRRGGTSIEFAFILVAFLLLLAGTVEFGRFLHLRSAIAFAGEVVLREAAVSQTMTVGELEQSLRQKLTQLTGADLQVAATYTPGAEPALQLLSLSVAYTFRPATPFLSATPWPINVTALQAVRAAS